MDERYSLIVKNNNCIGISDTKKSIDYVNLNEIVKEMNRLNNQLEYLMGDEDERLKNYSEFWEEKFEKMEDFDEELLEKNRNYIGE